MAAASAALSLRVVAECGQSRARACELRLPHGLVNCPVFMPVGTQGTMKGLTATQLESLGCSLCLGNTYHLGMRPGPELIKKASGLHGFMNWPKNLLTDSGGFQMVSLVELSKVTEEGVHFCSPYDGQEILLTPEKSIEIQNALGSDIIMQLDDVVSSTVSGPRVEDAMLRSIRWLDRCIAAHSKPDQQNLFAIIQGGLDSVLRTKCLEEMTKRDVPGFAIGGLSGGEAKDHFWRMVSLSTKHLPKNKPRYLMGVGYATDLVVCVALGCDMFDCVYPTRTARFGSALVPWGSLQLKNKQYAKDFRPIDANCNCPTCQRYSRAFLNALYHVDPAAKHHITIHNVAYQVLSENGKHKKQLLPQKTLIFHNYHLHQDFEGATKMMLGHFQVLPTFALFFLCSTFLFLLVVWTERGNREISVLQLKSQRILEFKWKDATWHPLEIVYSKDYNFLLNEPDKCQEKSPFLVLFVITKSENFVERIAIRQTWGNESSVPGVSILRLFLIGVLPIFGSQLQNLLEQESSIHKDIIQQDYLDTYNNLTLKTLMGMEWISKFCPNATYVMKADSDIFLNVDYLVSQLLQPHLSPKKDYITGYIHWNTKPIRHMAYKWYVPLEIYPNDTYPPYPGGPGYVFSGDLAKKIYRVAHTIKVINTEDAFIGICLYELGITVTDSALGLFNMEKIKYEKCKFSKLVVVHRYEAEELIKIWPDFQNQAKICRN